MEDLRTIEFQARKESVSSPAPTRTEAIEALVLSRRLPGRGTPDFWQLVIVFGACLLAYALNQTTGLFFGGVFAIAVAVAFGPKSGVLVVAAAALTNIDSLNSYFWRFLLYGIEAYAIGYFSARGRKLLMIDSIYWAAIGCPILFGREIIATRTGIDWSWIALVLLPANGILNVLTADLFLDFRSIQNCSHGRGVAPRMQSLRSLLLHALLLMGTAPLLLMTLVEGENMRLRVEEETSGLMQDMASDISARVDEVVKTHENALDRFGNTLKSEYNLDPTWLDARLASFRSLYPNFQTLTLLDQRERMLGSWPPQKLMPGEKPPFPVEPRWHAEESGVTQFSDAFAVLGSKNPSLIIAVPTTIANGARSIIVTGSITIDITRQATSKMAGAEADCHACRRPQRPHRVHE